MVILFQGSMAELDKNNIALSLVSILQLVDHTKNRDSMLAVIKDFFAKQLGSADLNTKYSTMITLKELAEYSHL